MNQQGQPGDGVGPDAFEALRAESAADLRELRAADPMSAGADELTLRRIRGRVMSEVGITSSPVIPAPSNRASVTGQFSASLSRLRQGGASSRRALLAVAAVAAAVMVGVITRPATVQNNDDVAASGPIVQSQLKAAEDSQDQQPLDESLSAAADEPRTSSDSASSVISSDEQRISKLAVRESCFGDGSADALQCGYPMVDYGTKQASEPGPAQDEWVGALAQVPMTVSVDKPSRSKSFVEDERFVAEYDTTVRISNSHDVDADFGGPVVIEQELLMDGTWFGCQIVDAGSSQWLTSLSGSQPSLTSLRAGETATRSIAARCTFDSPDNPGTDVFPRTLVNLVADGALLFRIP